MTHEPAPRVLALHERPPTPDAPVVRYAGASSTLAVVGEGGALPEGADALLVVEPGGALEPWALTAPAPAGVAVPGRARALAYVAHVAAPPEAAPLRLRADPESVRLNEFKPLFENARAAAALLSVAAGRRVDSGPEVERTFIVLAGSGLVFLQDESTLAYREGDAIVVPAGEPARLWARGPEDARLVVFQPQAPPAERRTLRGELAKRQLLQRSAPQEPGSGPR